ncbi:GDSL-type esterase/lipase family protein [Paenibacillus marinisediminis]
MKQRSASWTIIYLLGIGSTLLLLVGFGLGVADIVSPGSVPFTEKPTVQAPPVTPSTERNELNIVSLGDSLTRGTGDDTGSGYVRRTVTLLEQEQDKPVKLINNLAINGQRADQLAKSLDKESTGHTLKQANIILLTIGGNDLFQSALRGKMGHEQLDLKTLQTKAMEGLSSLESVLSKIRQWNPDALVVYVGLYNPFSDLEEMREIGNTVVQGWNDAAATFINKDSNMILIPTQDLFEFNIETYLSSDHFHPNGEGYEAIATRVVQSIPHSW